eukprot:gene35165-42594_t
MSEVVFEAAVRDIIKIPDALVDEEDVTFEYVMVVQVDFELLFYTTQVPSPNASVGFQEVVDRFNESVLTGQFSWRLQARAEEVGSFSMVYAQASRTVDSLVVNPTFRSDLTHSAYPSSQPTTSPSSQPSSQPSSVPTSNPTLSYETRWAIRVEQEIQDYYTQSNQHLRAIYFEVGSMVRSVYGGNGSYIDFMRDSVFIPLKYKTLMNISFVMVESLSAPTVSIECGDYEYIRELEIFFGSDPCVQECVVSNSTSIYNPDHSGEGLNPWLSSIYNFCTYNEEGYIKLFMLHYSTHGYTATP